MVLLLLLLLVVAVMLVLVPTMAFFQLLWTFPFSTIHSSVRPNHPINSEKDYLMTIQKHPIKSKFCKLRLLCRSLAGNNVYCLTVTAPVADDDSTKVKYFTYFCFYINFIHLSLPPAWILYFPIFFFVAVVVARPLSFSFLLIREHLLSWLFFIVCKENSILNFCHCYLYKHKHALLYFPLI